MRIEKSNCVIGWYSLHLLDQKMLEIHRAIPFEIRQQWWAIPLKNSSTVMGSPFEIRQQWWAIPFADQGLDLGLNGGKKTIYW